MKIIRSKASPTTHRIRVIWSLQDKTRRYNPDVYITLQTRFALDIVHNNLLDSYSESMKHPEKDKWVEAMKTQMEDLKRRGVFKLLLFHEGVTPIPTRWVFDRKRMNLRQIIFHFCQICRQRIQTKIRN